MTRIPAAFPRNLEPAGRWLTDAACRGAGDTMFPGTLAREIKAAKKFCRACPVILECRRWALDQRIAEGVWGGLSEGERFAILHGKNPPAAMEEAAPPRPKLTLRSVWERSVQLVDGHAVWTGYQPVAIGGKNHTPQQVAFKVDRGRDPVGVVRRTCDADGCVLPAHLADQAERDARRQVSEQPSAVAS
jgi:WhiB family redox-sensing transcriptional regulator